MFRKLLAIVAALGFAQLSQAAITFVGAGAVTQSNAATISPAIPAGSTGDLIICSAQYKNASFTLTAPSGATYTQIITGYKYHGVWGRIANGTDAFTLGTAGSDPLLGYIESSCLRYAGTASTITSISDASTTNHISLVDQLRVGGIKPSSANEMVIYFGRELTVSTSTALATGFTSRVNSSYAASNMSMVVADSIQTIKTNIIQQNLVITGGSGVTQAHSSLMLAIKPAGSGGGGGSQWTYVGAGSIAQSLAGGVNLTPSLPTGQVAGDWLCWMGYEATTSFTLNHPAGYTNVVSRQVSAHDVEAIDCKVSAGASEVAPTVAFQSRSQAQVVAFRGGPAAVAGNVHVAGSAGSTCTISPPSMPLTITQPNTLVLEWAKWNSDFGTITSYPVTTTGITASVITGNPSSFFLAYVIQTAATNMATDAFTTTPATGSTACSKMAVSLLAGTVTPPTITTVNGGGNTFNSDAVGVVIVGTGFGASQGTGSVTVRDGSLSSTQTVTAWGDTSITFTGVRGDIRYGARNVRVTNGLGTFVDQAVTVTAPPAKCYFDLGAIVQPFSVSNKGMPNRFGDASGDITDDSQLEFSNMVFNGGSTCANITIATNGTFRIPSDLLALDWIWNSGLGWKDTVTQRRGANKARGPATSGFRASCTGTSGDNTNPPARVAYKFKIAVTGGDYPATSTGISNCMAALANGQACEMQAADPLVAETWDAEIDITSINGVEGNVKTLRVRDGDTITLSHATVAPTGLLNITSSSFINIQGGNTLENGLYLGDSTQWLVNCARATTAVDFIGVHNCYTNANNVMITGSTNIGLMNFTVRGAQSNEASVIDNTSSYIYSRQMVWDLHGINNDGGVPVAAPSGTLLVVHADYFVAEDTTFSHGGANALKITGSFPILRRVKGNGGWSDVSLDPVYSGSTPIVLATQDCQVASNGCAPYGPALIENSEIFGAGTIPGQTWNYAIQLGAIGTIFRQNYIYGNTKSYLLGMCSSADINTTTYREGEQSIYNNTF